jgi:hypothetical protein
MCSDLAMRCSFGESLARLDWGVVLEMRLAKPKTTTWRPNRAITQLPAFRLEQSNEPLLLGFGKWHKSRCGLMTKS